MRDVQVKAGLDASAETDEQYEDIKQQLLEMVSVFAQKNNLSYDAQARLLVDLALDKAILEYLFKTKKASEPGLKRHIERFQRKVDKAFETAKKEADFSIVAFQASCLLATLQEEAEQDAA